MAATSRYMLDTNILSGLIKNPHGPLANRVNRRITQIRTSVIVACELRYGATKKGSERLRKKVEDLLAHLPVLPLEHGMDRQYGEIRTHLERQGQPIGSNDLLIAAQARHLGLILVTANVGEFERVPGLRVENWIDTP